MQAVAKEATTSGITNSNVREAVTVFEILLRSLVDTPAKVMIDIVEGGHSVIFEVRVDKDDVRRIIGRRGRTADALREILTNLGGKAGLRYHLEIIDP